MPEAAKASVNKVWAKWESQVVNGSYPLIRFLDQSDHSVVFVTENRAQGRPEAAIKIIPADPALADTQLSHWKTAAALAHPHLLRILDSGRCQLGGHPFLFVVMELAEQTLAQVLPKRALTVDETREMLVPSVQALAYLHDQNLVHGQLKPTNVLVVNDQLKLASDSVRPIAKPSASIAKPSVYDAPESRDGRITVAGDMWGLGATMLEALTQLPPAWPGDRTEPISLPPSVPVSYVEMIRRCLSRSPGARPTMAEFRAWLTRPAQQNPVPAADPRSSVAEAARPPKVADRPTLSTISEVWEAAEAAHASRVTPPIAAPTAATSNATLRLDGGSASAPSAIGPPTNDAPRIDTPRIDPPRNAASPANSAAVKAQPMKSKASMATPSNSATATASTAAQRELALPASQASRVAPALATPRGHGAGEPLDEDESRYSKLPVSGIVVFLAVLIVIWAGVQIFRGHASGPVPAVSTPTRDSPSGASSVTTPFPAGFPSAAPRANADPRAAASRAAPRLPDASATAQAPSSAVLHEEIPVVSRSARETIQGRIKVAVRVTVDRSGAVVGEVIETPGPSRYFARLATEAARKWKFTPADGRTPREWLLRFEFSKDGATAHAVPRA